GVVTAGGALGRTEHDEAWRLPWRTRGRSEKFHGAEATPLAGHANGSRTPERGTGRHDTEPGAGLAPSAAAGGEHPDHVAGRDLAGALVGQSLGPGLVASWQQPVLPHCAGCTPAETPWPRHPPLRDQRDRR